MKTLILLLSAAAIGGCASSNFDRQAEFPLHRYAGDTPFMQLLDKVNLEANLHRPCAQITRCQDTLPSRDELHHTAFLDAKGYSLAKAYALQNAGIDESRMRVAAFPLMNRSHMVLVVDDRWVLDNAYMGVRRIEQYEKFHAYERLASLPVTLMAEGRPGSAAVGR